MQSVPQLLMYVACTLLLPDQAIEEMGLRVDGPWLSRWREMITGVDKSLAVMSHEHILEACNSKCVSHLQGGPFKLELEIRTVTIKFAS